MMGLCDRNDLDKGKKRAPDEHDYSSHPPSTQKKVKQSESLISRLSEQTGGLNFAFEPLLLAEALYDKKVWRDHTIEASVGFVMTCSREMSDGELTNQIKDMIVGHDKSASSSNDTSASSSNDTTMRRAVYDFLCKSSDTIDQITVSVAALNSSSDDIGGELAGEADLRWWRVDPDRCNYYRQLTYFRRLMRPICVRVLQSNDDSFVAYKSNLSLLQILLDLPHIQEYAIDAILMQICCLPDEEKLSGKETKFLQSLLKEINKMVQSDIIQNMTAYQDVATFVCSLRPGLEDKLPSVPSGEYDRSVTNKEKGCVWREYMDRIKGKATRSRLLARSRSRSFNSKSCDPTMVAGREKYLKRRQELLKEHKKRKLSKAQNSEASRQSTRRIVPKSRETDGSIVYTDQDMTLPEFIDELKFMEKVNDSFLRNCNPEQSRPRMQQVELSDAKICALKKLIFDDDGSLSNKIKQDIDTSSKHGYINFTNLLCHKERKDQRWQVPIRKHGTGSVITTRAAAENIFTGIFDPRYEALYDLGILIGGTEDQSLHHDVARQYVSWIPERKGHSADSIGMNPVGGWEIDRLAYNEAMASPNAPSSVLIGMGDAKEVLLGVQKDQIVRFKNSNMCRILGGKKGQQFEIVRENEFLVVLRAKTGVMFTGDFPHAGVRNVKVDSHQDDLLKCLNQRIECVLGEFSDHDRLGETRAIIEVLCNFPNLDKLCRLHCSTEMTTSNLCIPANTIGFCDCLANPPDARCLEDDKPLAVDEELPDVPVGAHNYSEGDDDSEEPEWVDDDDTEWVGDVDDSVPTLCSSTVGDHTKNFAQS